MKKKLEDLVVEAEAEPERAFWIRNGFAEKELSRNGTPLKHLALDKLRLVFGNMELTMAKQIKTEEALKAAQESARAGKAGMQLELEYCKENLQKVKETLEHSQTTVAIMRGIISDYETRGLWRRIVG